MPRSANSVFLPLVVCASVVSPHFVEGGFGGFGRCNEGDDIYARAKATSAAPRALPLQKDDVSDEIARKRSVNGYNQVSGGAAGAPKTLAHLLANVLQVRSHSHRAYAHNLWAYPNLSSVPVTSEVV